MVCGAIVYALLGGWSPCSCSGFALGYSACPPRACHSVACLPTTSDPNPHPHINSHLTSNLNLFCSTQHRFYFSRHTYFLGTLARTLHIQHNDIITTRRATSIHPSFARPRPFAYANGTPSLHSLPLAARPKPHHELAQRACPLQSWRSQVLSPQYPPTRPNTYPTHHPHRHHSRTYQRHHRHPARPDSGGHTSNLVTQKPNLEGHI